jgi:hypothetical protein
MSLPQIVIDSEIATVIRRLPAGTQIPPRRATMADTIERSGFRGEFLKEKGTAWRQRADEQFMPVIASSVSREARQAAGRDEFCLVKSGWTRSRRML